MGVGGTPVTPISKDGVAFPAGTVADPITVTLGGDTAGDATAANQVIQITAEQAILAKLTSDPATQTTLAAILAKIIAAPATAANQATEITSLASLVAQLPAALGAGGGLKVDGSGTALPVSGTVTANLGTIGGAATQTTLAAISAQLPSTVGQKTAANSLSVAWASDAVGTAGSPAATVVSVQGVASGTAIITGGNVASGTADSGNPQKVGARFDGTSTLPTFTTGQRTDLLSDAQGNLRTTPTSVAASATDGFSNANVGFSQSGTNGGIVRNINAVANYVFNSSSLWDRTRGDVNGTVVQQGAMAPSRWNYAAAAGGITSSTSATIAAAAGASVRNYVTGFDLSWTSLTASTEVVIRDGAAGTVKERLVLPAGSSGTFSRTFNAPLQGTANTLMEVAVLTNPVAGAIYFNASGFTGT